MKKAMQAFPTSDYEPPKTIQEMIEEELWKAAKHPEDFWTISKTVEGLNA